MPARALSPSQPIQPVLPKISTPLQKSEGPQNDSGLHSACEQKQQIPGALQCFTDGQILANIMHLQNEGTSPDLVFLLSARGLHFQEVLSTQVLPSFKEFKQVPGTSQMQILGRNPRVAGAVSWAFGAFRADSE